MVVTILRRSVPQLSTTEGRIRLCPWGKELERPRAVRVCTVMLKRSPWEGRGRGGGGAGVAGRCLVAPELRWSLSCLNCNLDVGCRALVVAALRDLVSDARIVCSCRGSGCVVFRRVAAARPPPPQTPPCCTRLRHVTSRTQMSEVSLDHLESPPREACVGRCRSRRAPPAPSERVP